MSKPELIAPDEPSPVLELNSQGTADIVLIADHAGRRIPRALGSLGLDESDLDRHIAWDIGIAGVTKRLAASLDAPAIMQVYSRLVIDCNRPPGVASSIPVLSEATRIPGNEGLDSSAAEARRAEIFAPYHARIAALLAARGTTGRRSVLIAMHSFTPVYLGVARPMHAGLLYNRDARLAHALLGRLRAEDGLIVGDNEPYRATDATDYAIPVHGERRGLLHVGVEIRQDLIAQPDGQAQWAARLARVLPAALADLRDGS